MNTNPNMSDPSMVRLYASQVQTLADIIIGGGNVPAPFFEVQERLTGILSDMDEARHVAELLRKEVDYMAKRYVGKHAAPPPPLPWQDRARVTLALASESHCIADETADGTPEPPAENASLSHGDESER